LKFDIVDGLKMRGSEGGAKPPVLEYRPIEQAGTAGHKNQLGWES